MSLFKQLWLAIILLLVVVFGGTLVVTSLSAKQYLEQQLFMKNSDNASALALALTRQEADPVLLELTVKAQFDSGHYEMIELRDPEGEVIIRREDQRAIDAAPQWFKQLLPIEVAPGVAQIQRDWQQLGTLRLRSHSRFAYEELWHGTLLLSLVFLAAILVSGLLVHFGLRRVLRPLDDVISQAKAIGERRFVTIDEPSTTEFRQLARVMNDVSERVRKTLHNEAKRMEKWQRQTQVDQVTGLNSRDSFMQNLESTLHSDDANASGTLALIRLNGLARLNQIYGRKTIDGLLAKIGRALRGMTASQGRWSAARLNGSDFAILAPRALEGEKVARDAQDAMHAVLTDHSLQEETTLPAAATTYTCGESVAHIMTRLDGSLLASDREGHSAISIAYEGDVQMLPMREQMARWRKIFERALRDRQFYLAAFPVVDCNERLIHLECPARLRLEDDKLPAGRFLPWINRLEMSRELDQYVVERALELIAEHQHPVCVNLSAAAIDGPNFNLWLCDRLSSQPQAAAQLWIEVAEPVAFRRLEDFKRLCERVRLYKTRIGIEHVGHQLADIGKLHDVGLDYLKVDATFVRDVDSNIANQTLLRTLCTVGHSLGLRIIAEGVRNRDEWHALVDLGMDGLTGPGISRQTTHAAA